MTRRKFIESQGATCRNWQWSWSFINEEKKFIIFGAWDLHTSGSKTDIFREGWEFSETGQRTKGFKQSREHIRLIEEQGYDLYTFPMQYSDAKKDESGVGPAKMAGFDPVLKKCKLIRAGSIWYASDDSPIVTMAEEVDPLIYREGACKEVSINSYERNSKAREKCLAHYGYRCQACNMLFSEVYGGLGENFIHVHHLTPISEISEEYTIDPIVDLVPVCPNCHAIIHSTKTPLTLEQIKDVLKPNK